jgi:hypothetical protein
MKVHTRSSLPPDHPSPSLDLTWSSQASPRKLEENKDEMEKQMSLCSKSWLPSIPSRVYIEAPKILNYPYLITRDTSHSRANLEVFRFSPSDGWPAIASCLASTQALQSRRVSSASKLLGASDQGGLIAPPRAVRPAQAVWPPLPGSWTGLGGRTSSSSLRLRFCGSPE